MKFCQMMNKIVFFFAIKDIHSFSGESSDYNLQSAGDQCKLGLNATHPTCLHLRPALLMDGQFDYGLAAHTAKQNQQNLN